MNKTILPNFGVNKIRLWEEYFLKFSNMHEFGKFFCENYHISNIGNSSNFPLYENINNNNLGNNNINSMKNTLDYLDAGKKKILNTQFYENEKLNDSKIIEQKNSEIFELNESIKELSKNIAFSISDYNTLSQKTKNRMEQITGNKAQEIDGFIYFRNAMSNMK